MRIERDKYETGDESADLAMNQDLVGLFDDKDVKIIVDNLDLGELGDSIRKAIMTPNVLTIDQKKVLINFLKKNGFDIHDRESLDEALKTLCNANAKFARAEVLAKSKSSPGYDKPFVTLPDDTSKTKPLFNPKDWKVDQDVRSNSKKDSSNSGFFRTNHYEGDQDEDTSVR